MPERFRHTIRVRYSECDLQGVVFNANYLTYVDDALTELWRAAVPGGYTGMVDSGVDMVVGEANIRYLAPARVDDVLDLDVSVGRLGTTGMTLEVAIGCDGRALTEVTMRYVFVTAKEGGKVPIPDPVRSALEPYAG